MRRSLPATLVASVALLVATPAYAGGSSFAGHQRVRDVPRTQSAPRSNLVFHFNFNNARRVNGHLRFRARGGSVGVVRTAHGGRVRMVRHGRGRAVKLPRRCDGGSCPRAMINVRHRPRLNPRRSNFSFGARVRVRANETASGANVIQKGRHGDKGQWKLQIDGDRARPSCVVHGSRGDVLVESRRSVDNGKWHRVRCVKTARALAVVVDGHRRAKRVSLGSVSNRDPVRIGSPGLEQGDDQYHGRLDGVFLRVRR